MLCHLRLTYAPHVALTGADAGDYRAAVVALARAVDVEPVVLWPRGGVLNVLARAPESELVEPLLGAIARRTRAAGAGARDLGPEPEGWLMLSELGRARHGIARMALPPDARRCDYCGRRLPPHASWCKYRIEDGGDPAERSGLAFEPGPAADVVGEATEATVRA
jgi:hypothetical protein